jgi:hypothetical protein
MSKYGGLAGVYYYKAKSDADSIASSRRRGGWRVSVEKYFDLWEVVIRPPKKGK